MDTGLGTKDTKGTFYGMETKTIFNDKNWHGNKVCKWNTADNHKRVWLFERFGLYTYERCFWRKATVSCPESYLL